MKNKKETKLMAKNKCDEIHTLKIIPYLNKRNLKNLDYNIGIAIIRVLLSYMVVFDHMYSAKKKEKYLRLLHCHIPTFFIISFYFTNKTLISFNTLKIKQRFERLFVPYFTMCIYSWILYNIYFYLFKRKVLHSFEYFVINLLNGRVFNVVLWFQNNLIFINLIFLIIIFLFKAKYMVMLNILAFICYILQYSGINYNFFKNNFSHNSGTSIGRYAESFPLAFTGFFLASIAIIDKAKKNKKQFFYISIASFALINKYDIFQETKNFKYSGFRLNISAICIFIIFSLFPSEKIKNQFILKIIKKISGYSGGIYFTHYLIGKGYILSKISLIKNGTFLGTFIVYLVSYIVCCIGLKMFGKTRFKHIFS